MNHSCQLKNRRIGFYSTLNYLRIPDLIFDVFDQVTHPDSDLSFDLKIRKAFLLIEEIAHVPHASFKDFRSLFLSENLRSNFFGIREFFKSSNI